MIHQLADQTALVVRTKCGLEIDRKKDKTTAVSIWWQDVSCPDCEPDTRSPG